MFDEALGSTCTRTRLTTCGMSWGRTSAKKSPPPRSWLIKTPLSKLEGKEIA